MQFSNSVKKVKVIQGVLSLDPPLTLFCVFGGGGGGGGAVLVVEVVVVGGKVGTGISEPHQALLLAEAILGDALVAAKVDALQPTQRQPHHRPVAVTFLVKLFELFPPPTAVVSAAVSRSSSSRWPVPVSQTVSGRGEASTRHSSSTSLPRTIRLLTLGGTPLEAMHRLKKLTSGHLGDVQVLAVQACFLPPYSPRLSALPLSLRQLTEGAG
ncbi:hypothetical protein TYRP_010386 [Tyrophagus putrescentiae]|nr:hypothetical protein TYRP_010386 [Tyrophagus putrescentiae]